MQTNARTQAPFAVRRTVVTLTHRAWKLAAFSIAMALAWIGFGLAAVVTGSFGGAATALAALVIASTVCTWFHFAPLIVVRQFGWSELGKPFK